MAQVPARASCRNVSRINTLAGDPQRYDQERGGWERRLSVKNKGSNCEDFPWSLRRCQMFLRLLRGCLFQGFMLSWR